MSGRVIPIPRAIVCDNCRRPIPRNADRDVVVHIFIRRRSHVFCTRRCAEQWLCGGGI